MTSQNIRPEFQKIFSAFDNKRKKKREQEISYDVSQTVLRPMRDYRGKNEKRLPPRSLKSTRIENGIGTDDLKYISESLTKDSITIGEKTWGHSDISVEFHRKLSTSGVRKELEIASDKLHLIKNAPDLVLQGIVYAINDYKRILHDPTLVVIIAAKSYISDLKSTNLLTSEEINELSDKQNITHIICMDGFREFFFDWIKSPPARVKSIIAKSDKQWFESILNIAKTGTVNVNDKTLATKQLHEYLLIDTAFKHTPTVVELALFFDAGFRYYMSGLGGKHVYYWDWIRNEASRYNLYCGQL